MHLLIIVTFTICTLHVFNKTVLGVWFRLKLIWFKSSLKRLIYFFWTLWKKNSYLFCSYFHWPIHCILIKLTPYRKIFSAIYNMPCPVSIYILMKTHIETIWRGLLTLKQKYLLTTYGGKMSNEMYSQWCFLPGLLLFFFAFPLKV